jgi:hypothetical protein
MMPKDGSLLRIFVGESDRAHGQPLYEWIVLEARRAGLAGATVLRGILGYGASSRLHSHRIESLTLDLPIIVELVDTEPRLEAFLEQIEVEIRGGLATIEKASVRLYRSPPAQ